MKILHAIDAVSWRYGGTTATILPLCDALSRKANINVEIVTTDADGPGRRLSAPPAANHPIHMFHKDFAETWKFSRGMFRWLNSNVRDYDIIHAHGVWSFSTTAACRAARRQRVPYIVFPQGMLSNYTWTRSRLSSIQKRVYWRLIERKNTRGARRLHLTSEGEGREMEWLRLGIPISYIPLGLEPAAWETPIDRNWLRSRLGGKDRGRPIVLFLSRLHSKKGIVDYLLPAFRAVAPPAYLVIAGGPDPHTPAYFDHVRQTIQVLGLEDRVHMLGQVAPEERWPALDGADLFVLPSKQENFGLVVTEAMARGIPVIASEHAYASEHLDRAGGAGLVIPLKVDEFTRSMDQLLAEPQTRARMAQLGKAYAPRLAWDAVADDVVRMYETCLANSQ